eukprot:CAMPEP_0204262848 /NCGR_PEP_ID=MMETSP0468-20130131/7951_1 /ASSEMBLY_ACC=CAM_ASM_000383 /TAXON_ID=2969 /ORGANISM="Oxyrrhis marina" /LENGTH=39 /DNA_ID= /DNA_START= /DNA_END= /DNA_ORIENTATION=
MVVAMGVALFMTTAMAMAMAFRPVAAAAEYCLGFLVAYG